MRFHRFPALRLFAAPLLAALVAAVSLAAAGCASGPNSGSTSRGAEDTGTRFLHFTVSVNPNGVIDRSGRGYYVIELNATGEPIEVTDLDTFTDFIRYDGRNTDWFHRIANDPNPGFTFVAAGNLNAATSISDDGRTLSVVLDVAESTSFINQFFAADRFTAHLVTTDLYQGAIIGRALDTLGPGPNLTSNALQTVSVRKGLGAVQPFPPLYPDDSLNDWITRDDLAPDFPYANFDIAQFQIVAQ